MTLKNSSRYMLALSVTLSACAQLLCVQSSPAQIPGVPGTGTYPTTNSGGPIPGSGSGSSAALPNNSILTGKVATNIAPAEKLLAQGKYAEAEANFRDILVNSPQDVQATVGLGIALAKQFKLDGADALFDRVLTTDPNNATAYAGKATVMLNRLQSSSGSIRSQKDSILRQAQDYANRACQLSPANAEAHFELGQVYKEQGKLDDAASEFRNAINYEPQHSYAYSALGNVKLDQQSYAEAAENFKRAIELNSGNSQAHYGLGASYLKMGRTDDAIQELNTSLYQFPNSWPTRMALGQAYQAQNNTVAALKEYQLSTLIKPENVEPYLRMSEIRQDRGDLELAIADLRSGLSQDPYNLEIRERIADLNLRLEKPDDAIKGYQTILQMSPNDNRAVKGLSQALYMKAQKAAVGAMLASNDYESALKTLDDAIKLSPSDMELRLAKAKLMSLSGTKPDLSKISQPQNDGERIAYAQALMASGDFQNAATQMKTIVGDQTDPKQTFAVADIALMMHDLDNAEAAYKKALSLSGTPDRAQRGVEQVTDMRKTANDDLKVGNELLKKKQFDGAIDRFRSSIATNPTLADGRLGLAQALEKSPKAGSAFLNEAVQQYKYYLALSSDLPSKEQDRLNNQVKKLADKAAKLKQKEDRNKR